MLANIYCTTLEMLKIALVLMYIFELLYVTLFSKIQVHFCKKFLCDGVPFTYFPQHVHWKFCWLRHCMTHSS